MAVVRQFINRFFRDKFRFYGIWCVLILICIILSFSAKTFFTYSNLTNVARQVSVNIILACGMTVVIIAGGIDLSVGAVMAFSSFIMADAMKSMGLVPALLVGLLAGAVMGAINGFLVSRNKSLAFVITLGTMTVWRSFTAIYSGGLPISGFSETFQKISSGSLIYLPNSFLIALVTVFICKFLLEQTVYGKYVYAIGSNEQAARNCGVNVNSVVIAAYMISGLLAGLAGIVLTSRLDAAQVQGGMGYEMDVIAIIIIGGASLSGGKGRILGTLAGALVMGVMRNGLNLLNVSANWQQTVMGLIIIAAIMWDKRFKKITFDNTRKLKGDIKK